MNDNEFNALVEETFGQIEDILDKDDMLSSFSMVALGVLEIELPNSARIIVSYHSFSREIWVAALKGAYHFRWDKNCWQDTRGHGELFDVLTKLVINKMLNERDQR